MPKNGIFYEQMAVPLPILPVPWADSGFSGSGWPGEPDVTTSKRVLRKGDSSLPKGDTTRWP